MKPLQPSDLIKLNVLIIGCGNIAGKFDEGVTISEYPLTHAGAYKKDGRFNMRACVEPNEERLKDFMSAWNVEKGFTTVEGALASKIQFDVISICSPSGNHAKDMEFALALRPKIIFCEKPLTTSLNESRRLIKRCKEKNVLLLVNYSRRFDEDIRKLKAEKDLGKWGALRSITGYYNKGLLNNGSHMLDLINLFTGPIKILSVGTPVFDFFENDPSIPVWLLGADGEPIYLMCNKAKDYSLFEVQFIFQNGLISMKDGGFRWLTQLPIKSRIFGGYQTLDCGIEAVGAYSSVMTNAVDSIYQAVVNGVAIPSTGENALLVQDLCEQIKAKSVLV